MATDNSHISSRVKQKSRGKPFIKGDPRINRKGAPKRGQTWSESVKHLTSMTREELLDYVGGANTKVGKILVSMPQEIEVREAMIIAAIASFLSRGDSRILSMLMDRDEGKVTQGIAISKGMSWKEFIESDSTEEESTDGTEDISS